MNRVSKLSLYLILALIFSGSCERTRVVKRAQFHMGTVVEITALGNDISSVGSAVEAAFGEISRVESVMSRFREGSDIWRINQAAGLEPVVVSAEVFELLERSQRLSAASSGAFDITFAGLYGLWDFTTQAQALPAEQDIRERLLLVGYDKLILSETELSVFLEKPGMKLDLGGIAKGYAVDRAIQILLDHGIYDGLVNAGGDIRAMGSHKGRAWAVGVQDPRNKDNLLYRLEVGEAAVATSGDYEKFIILDGQRYCHIIDPRSGLPAAGVRSVTIAAPSAMLADAYATAVFVLGSDLGLQFLESEPDAESLIIDGHGQVLMSSGFTSVVSLKKISR